MILPIFSVYDSKALHYGQPHIQQNANVAIRAFSQAANTPDNPISQNPEDFSLIEIALFDDEKGVISAIDHKNHGLASSYLQGQ